MLKLTATFRDGTKRVFHGYKNLVGTPFHSATGGLILNCYITDSLKSRLMLWFGGVKSVDRAIVTFDPTSPTGAVEYYDNYFKDLTEKLRDEYLWERKHFRDVQQCFSQLYEAFSDIATNDINVDIPELVIQFYNFWAPHVQNY